MATDVNVSPASKVVGVEKVRKMITNLNKCFNLQSNSPVFVCFRCKLLKVKVLRQKTYFAEFTLSERMKQEI